MKYQKLFFQLAFIVCFGLFCARAQAAELEVQLGAFTIKSIARECVDEYAHLERDVFIKQIRNSAGKSYYTVRTGPFESVEQAREFVEALKPKPGDTPWIMHAGSMKPAARPREKTRETSAAASPAPEKEKPAASEESAPSGAAAVDSPDTPQTEVAEVEGSEEQNDSGEAEAGLWGTAESENEPADSEEGPTEKSGAGKPKTANEKSTETSAEAAASPDTGQPGSVKELQQEVKTLKEKVQTLLDAQEVRKELKATEEEKAEEEEDILSAAGRQYTLLAKGRLGVEYKLDYSYFAYDAVREQNIIEHNSQHNITNTFTLEYPLKNNLTLEAAIPFVYKYDKVGSDESKDVSDFGDVDFALNYQPLKSGGGFPSIILRTVLTCPMGRDPYDINSDTELSTGSGGYSLKGSMSVSKAVDPIMVFGSFGYTYKHPIDDLDYKLGSYTLERYERGDTLEFSMGIGYSLSYITSLTLGYSYSYSFEDERFFKEAEPQTYATRTDSSLNIGTSWRISQKMRINMSLGIGLANNDYFTLAFRFPYEYDL